MLRKYLLICFAGCLLSSALFAQQEKAKPQKNKNKPAKENIKCVPEQKPDTANIDLKTGKPKTAETDTTFHKN